MKNLYLIVLSLLFAPVAFAGNLQGDSIPKPGAKTDTSKTAPKSWFEKFVTIGQSMATTDQQQLPAQFTMTFPQNKPSSYLVNIGASVLMNYLSKGDFIVTKFTGEFHRNTLTDSVQDNWQIGFKSTFDFNWKDPMGGTHYNLIIDPQYTVDRIKMENSIASNILFTWNRDGGDGVNWSNNNFISGKRGSFIPILFAGTQLQQVFAGDTTAANGFKLRPLVTSSLAYCFFKKGDIFDPVVRLLASYTQRICAVNQTNDGEKWTHLFHAEADYFILLTPVKLSVGATFINGSDIFSGLKQQQYFLLSLNLFAGGK